MQLVAIFGSVDQDGIRPHFSGTNSRPPASAVGRTAATGRYRLSILDGAVTGPGGALDGNNDGTAGGAYQSPEDTAGSGTGYECGLYRLFGDATGNGVVDLLDLQAFRQTFDRTALDPGYLAYLDADNNNTVDLTDLAQFRTRFNVSLF